MLKTWFSAKKSAPRVGEVAIYDEIGMWGISAQDFLNAIKALGPVSTLKVYINSPGGSVTDGFAIYNILARHPATKDVVVDGLAASMASVIAMVGDTVTMPANATMMIHDPSGHVSGEAKELRKTADLLDRLKNSIVQAYVGRTGLDATTIAQMMADTTWLDADEAVALGFADYTAEPVNVKNTFDLSRFKNTPKGALAMSKVTRGQRKAAEAVEEASETDEASEEIENTNTQKAVKTATAAAKKNASDIVAACKLAGRDADAGKFIADGKTAAEVTALLGKEMDEKDEKDETSPRHKNRGSGDDAAATLDTKKIWDRFNGKKSA